MTLNVAFQMEPLAESDRESTNSLLLIQEANKRGFTVWQYGVDELSMSLDGVVAKARKVTVDLTQDEYYTLGRDEIIPLENMDVIFVRNLPYNMQYITATYMLEQIRDKVVFANDPFWVRNSPEKILPFKFQEFMPPTIISSNIDEIISFHNLHGDIILKPLYGYFGAGIKHITAKDESLKTTIQQMIKENNGQIQAQKFLPEVREKGNRRILFFDGKYAGVMSSVSSTESFNSNINCHDFATELTKIEENICHALGDYFKKHGLIFVGIDVIGDYITEINTTCVGSLIRFNKIYPEINHEALLWDSI